MNYITWNELLIKFESFSNYKLRRWEIPEHNGLHGASELPVSINESEFNFIKDYIVEHNLISGFDLSTGVGIGALAMGLGMKETGGRAVSFDAYQEEQTGVVPEVPTAELPAYQDADGYRIASDLLRLYGVDDRVELRIGWSPTDTVRYFDENDSRFDVVLLDCPKTMWDLCRDIGSLSGRLADRYAIFIHDTHCFCRDEFNKYINEVFGLTPVFLYKYYAGTPHHAVKHYPLALVTNL